MARGKYLSLEEARKKGLLKRFAKEHPSEGDQKLFDRLFRAMASGKPPAKPETSGGAHGEDYAETPPRKDTSEDAS